MTGRQRIRQKPTLRDRINRQWGIIALLIETGATPEPKDIAWLLRHGERDFDGSPVPVPPVVQRYLADMIDSPKSAGRPKLSALEIEFQQRDAACAFRDEIDRLAQRQGCEVPAALDRYADKHNRTRLSIRRRYRDALAVIEKSERRSHDMIVQAAQMRGISVADLLARIETAI